MFSGFLPAFLQYLIYLSSGLVLLAVFAVLYCRVTPIDELKLIRSRGHAAALSFGGAILGFSLTLAASAWHLNNWNDFMMWGMLAMVVQILVHVVVARCIHTFNEDLVDNNLAMGVLSGSIQLAAGLINAGSLS